MYFCISKNIWNDIYKHNHKVYHDTSIKSMHMYHITRGYDLLKLRQACAFLMKWSRSLFLFWILGHAKILTYDISDLLETLIVSFAALWNSFGIYNYCLIIVFYIVLKNILKVLKDRQG